MDTGTFMQCEGDVEHHNLFLCFRPDKIGFNHVAFEARNFDEVMEGGNYMIDQGWKEFPRGGAAYSWFEPLPLHPLPRRGSN